MSRALRNPYLIGAVLCAAVAINFATTTFYVLPSIGNGIADNCTRIHRLTRTLDQILINGRASAERYQRDGTITRVQLKRALQENDVARRKLYRADCPASAAPPLLLK